jgi:diketogulonate reductase-like aldo/keto reductase
MTMLTRPIPRTGEQLPVIGMGTWQTLDVPAGVRHDRLLRTLQAFLDAGGRIIDSSPMYGHAEERIGDLLAELKPESRPFLATKVWTRGQSAGVRQMEASLHKMRVQVIDLMQVHNLVEWKTHLATLRAWKLEGRVRYVGVTHYELGALDELASIVESGVVDFVQLPYSMTVRAAETRLLPAAAANGVAVLVMRPFREGALFSSVRNRPLPPLAGALGITSWSEYFLKWILGHPAVTAPIPATADPEHMAANLRAGDGPLPDEEMRAKMIAEL